MLTPRNPQDLRDEADRRVAAERRERLLEGLPSFVMVAVIIFVALAATSSAVLGWLTGVGKEPQLFITASAAAFFLGALVGATELVARYADAPAKALYTNAGVFYVLVNA